MNVPIPINFKQRIQQRIMSEQQQQQEIFILVLFVNNTLSCVGPGFNTLEKTLEWLENYNNDLIGNSEWKIVKRALNPNDKNIFLDQNMFSFIKTE